MKYITLLFASILCFTASHSQVIVTVAGTGTPGYSGDGGPATDAKMTGPYRLVFDKAGNFYFSDNVNPTIRKVDHSGIIAVVAGNGSSGYSGDGFPATLAQIKGGGGLAIDNWNNIYYADGSNHRVRKITPDGIIRTIAGTGIAGYNGDGIPATDAALNVPTNIAVDDTGNLYICDRVNYRLRKIDTFGVISTIAGTGVAGFTADGARADTAAIDESWCIIVNGNNIFYKDKYRIRKITGSTGLLTTVAGNGIDAYSGDGGPATTAAIATTQFTLDSVGNLYLSEGSTSRIRMVNTEGTITTVAGNGSVGVDAEGVSLAEGRVNAPAGIAFNPFGELFFADHSVARVRKITNHWASVGNTLQPGLELQVFPNPTRGTVEVHVTGITGEATLSVADILGAVVAEQRMTSNGNAKINVGHCPSGTYTVRVITQEKTIAKELLIK